MSALTVVECDLCGFGARGELGADPERLMADDGIVPGFEKGLPDLPHVHPSCADEHLRTGTPGDALAGFAMWDPTDG